MQQAKTNKRIWKLFCFLLLAGLCQTCAKSTLVASWTADSFDTPVQGTILVVGAFSDPIAHKIFEDSFAASLKKTGINAVPSYRYGLGAARPSKEELQQAVKKSGAETFLLTYLLSEKTSTEEYLTAHRHLATVMYWDSAHNYHALVYDEVWGGDVVTRKVNRMEASLFESKSGKHIWSARSKSINFEDLLREDDEQLEHLFIRDLQHHKIL